MPRPHLLVSPALAAGALVTVVTALPGIELGGSAPAAHAAIESLAALAPLLAAYLFFGRLHQAARRDDLALFSAFLLLGLANLLFAGLPAALSASHGLWAFGAWAQAVAVLPAAALFALAGRLTPRPVAEPRLGIAVSVAAVSVAAAAAGAAVALAGPNVHPEAAPSHPVYLSLQLGTAMLVLGGAIGFVRRVEPGDRFVAWLVAGATLAAFARLNAVLAPPPSADWVSPADVLRCGFYAALLFGAATEIRGYWSRLAAAAVLAERRRIARDLHDGLAQELAFIVGRAKSGRRLADAIAEIEQAAQRALDDSRRAISALAAESDEPLEDTLAAMLDEVAARMGVSIELDLEQGMDVAPAAREALLRISREALLNAARHGEAHSVRVRLAGSRETELEIVDDGSGFDPEEPSRDRTRFGLVSMRERARNVGGELRVRSKPGRGTKVKVVLPR